MPINKGVSFQMSFRSVSGDGKLIVVVATAIAVNAYTEFTHIN